MSHNANGEASPNDLKWLRDQLEFHRVPQRLLAKELGMDTATLSRALSGQRKLRLGEFADAVRFLESKLFIAKTPLTRAMWEARMSVMALSQRSGIDFLRLTNLMDSKGEPATAAEEAALRAALGLPQDSASLADIGARQKLVEVRELNRQISGADLIPVFGAPMLDESGLFKILRTPVETRPVPPGLVGVVNAFAIFVGDDLWVPRYHPGELLFLHPSLPPQAGRWMIVSLEEGTSLLGKLVEIDSKALKLEQNSSMAPSVVPRKAVAEVATVLGTWFQ